MGPKVWAALARKMGPQTLRMNLNTLLRHGAFDVAPSLRDGGVDTEVSHGVTDPHVLVATMLNYGRTLNRFSEWMAQRPAFWKSQRYPWTPRQTLLRHFSPFPRDLAPLSAPID